MTFQGPILPLGLDAAFRGDRTFSQHPPDHWVVWQVLQQSPKLALGTYLLCSDLVQPSWGCPPLPHVPKYGMQSPGESLCSCLICCFLGEGIWQSWSTLFCFSTAPNPDSDEHELLVRLKELWTYMDKKPKKIKFKYIHIHTYNIQTQMHKIVSKSYLNLCDCNHSNTQQ